MALLPIAVALKEKRICVCVCVCPLLAATGWVERLNFQVGRCGSACTSLELPRCRGYSPARTCGFGSRIPLRLEMSQGMAGERGF